MTRSDIHWHNRANGQRTFYTLQLYLPSDTSGSAASFVPAVGGTTRFWGDTGREYADVEALPGRVLVFQHDTLLHTGEEVSVIFRFRWASRRHEA